MSKSFEEIRPVVITAPTARNGVTLIQRLLNSTRQIIVYGENAHFCQDLPLQVFRLSLVSQKAQSQFGETRRRFFNETTEFWTSNLNPDFSRYAQLLFKMFQEFVKFYQDSAESDGFSQWGIKYPFNNVESFDRFYTLVPQGRYIYIYRNLFDVARSCKARQFTVKLQDYENLARVWDESVKLILQKPQPNLMAIRYEDLIADSSIWLGRIEQFTDIHSIDPQVMTRKFNTFRGSPTAGHSVSEYIAPLQLTTEENDALKTHASQSLEMTGHADSAAS